jgi:Zn-dependent protease
MRGSVRIGRIAGVPIRVHWSFSLLVAYVLIVTSGETRSIVIEAFAWIAALFASVTVHELSHCAVARRRGLAVRDIVLLPIGGVSEIEGLPGEPRTERDVAIAGPLASIGLALLFGVLALLTGASLWPPALFAGSWLTRLAWLNLVLAAFNLVPALPMDGGRVLRAVLAGRRDEAAATNIAARVAQVIGAVMIGFVFLDPWLALIGAFVLMGASAERRAARVRMAMRQFRIGDLMAPDQTAVAAGVSVADLGNWLSVFPGRAVPVTDAGAYVGIVAIEDLLGAQPWSSVGTVCDRSAPVLHAEDPALGALEAFSHSRRRQLAVTYLGQPVGVLYSTTVEAVLRPQAMATS